MRQHNTRLWFSLMPRISVPSRVSFVLSVACALSISLVLSVFSGPVAFAQEAAPSPAANEPSLEELLGTRETLSSRKLVSPKRKRGKGVSQGTTSTGTLLAGRDIVLDGKTLGVLPTHRDKARNFGADNLVTLLEDASATVAEAFPGSRLLVGDGSAAEGGDLSGHASHNCGRDVDIAFYAMDDEEQPVAIDKMKRYDDTGTCCGGTQKFDVARNWAFVQAALSHPDVEVQYIFVWEPLRQILLTHAREHATDTALVARAEKILRQPSDSSAHSNHFHLRVFCSRRDRVEGCLNRGPDWAWANTHDDAATARASRLAESLANGDSRRLASDALTMVAGLSTPQVVPLLAESLPELSLELQRSVLATIDLSGVPPEAASALMTAFRASDDPSIRARLLGFIGRSGAPEAIPFLASVAADSEREREAVGATRAMVRLRHRDAVPGLIALLSHATPEVHATALQSLREITNHHGAEENIADWWASWWATHAGESRDDWWVAGFGAVGIEMAHIEDASAIDALIAAQTSAPGYVADNAHRTIMRTVGYWFSPSLSPRERQKKWETWWSRNAWRFEE